MILSTITFLLAVVHAYELFRYTCVQFDNRFQLVSRNTSHCQEQNDDTEKHRELILKQQKQITLLEEKIALYAAYIEDFDISECHEAVLKAIESLGRGKKASTSCKPRRPKRNMIADPCHHTVYTRGLLLIIHMMAVNGGMKNQTSGPPQVLLLHN